MKNKIYKSGITLLLSFLSINYGIALGDQKNDSQKHIQLNNDSEIKEIILQVKDSVNSLTIEVRSNLQGGELSVEILDPKGDIHGKFSIASQTGNISKNKNEYEVKSRYLAKPDNATGNLTRTIRKPLNGDWRIRINPINAIGTVNIDYAQKSIAPVLAPVFIILK